MDEKIKYPQGIYGDPAIPSQKLTRNKDYYGQIRLDKNKLAEYFNSHEGDYVYLDMFIQKENRKRLRFLVVFPKDKK